MMRCRRRGRGPRTSLDGMESGLDGSRDGVSPPGWTCSGPVDGTRSPGPSEGMLVKRYPWRSCAASVRFRRVRKGAIDRMAAKILGCFRGECSRAGATIIHLVATLEPIPNEFDGGSGGGGGKGNVDAIVAPPGFPAAPKLGSCRLDCLARHAFFWRCADVISRANPEFLHEG